MEWEKHKENKLHAFHNKKTRLHIQGETQWCFGGWLGTHLQTQVGGLCEGPCWASQPEH